MTDYSTDFSRRLEALAKENKTTQAAIHRKTGAAKSSISAWFKGTTTPHINFIAPLAKLLNTTTDELLTGRKPTIQPNQATQGWTANLINTLEQNYKENGDIKKETFLKAVSLLQEP